MPRVEVDHFKVQEVKVLTKMPTSTEALKLLHQVLNQVQPIMRKRQLKVPLVSEMFPKRANLLGLNINGGGGKCREIKIRLRHSYDSALFLDFNSVLGTMLHELCHNTISTHNKAFFALLDQLWEECEELMDKGISGSGTGFDAPAAGKLGGRLHKPSGTELRETMRKAAEVRARRNGLMQPGPHRLGGGRLPGNLPPAQAAALAAERRALAQAACGCDEVHGTQLGYDEEHGQVIVLDDNHARDPSLFDGNLGTAGRSRQAGAISTDHWEDDRSKRGASAVSIGASGRMQGRGAAGQCGVIDLTLSDDEDDSPAVGAFGHGQHDARPGGLVGNSVGVHKRLRLGQNAGGAGWEWGCSACTFLNAPWTEACTMCNALRTSS